jgi:ribosomal protein S18 acetylase RimI-like enzyme
MQAVLDELARAGATGVHLGVDEANTGAQAFYERLGFSELAGSPGARFYGMPLG